MMKPASAKEVSASTHNAFGLKNEFVDLLPQRWTAQGVTLEQLELNRTTRRAVPASKHGLEVICGASCETGAQ